MSQKMKLKIISDGSTAGTYVCHAETGERLAGVQLLSWSASTDSTESEATLHLWGVPCEITAEVGMMVVDDVIEETAFPSLPPEYEADESGSTVIDITHLLKRL